MGNIKAVAFDLDGTIYYGNQVAEGAIETIDFLKSRNMKIVYFSNNSVNTRQQIYEKLCMLGLALDISDVYSSGYASGRYLKEQGLNRVYCLGSDGLKWQLESQGITLSNGESDLDAILVGLDREFSYDKLADALKAFRPGIKVLACNLDKSYPIENGSLMPGCGALVASLETALGRPVDGIVGKPCPFILNMILQDLGLESKEVLVVGDTEESDIEMAHRSGTPCILITSSATISSKANYSIQNLGQIRYIVNSLNNSSGIA